MKNKYDELTALREKCSIMRNMLRDIQENENLFDELACLASDHDFENAIQMRAARRKALVEEIHYFLISEEYLPELRV